jgi:hypothetical protein
MQFIHKLVRSFQFFSEFKKIKASKSIFFVQMVIMQLTIRIIEKITMIILITVVIIIIITIIVIQLHGIWFKITS